MANKKFTNTEVRVPMLYRAQVMLTAYKDQLRGFPRCVKIVHTPVFSQKIMSFRDFLQRNRVFFLVLISLVVLARRFRLGDLYREQKRRRDLLKRLPGPPCGGENEHWMFGNVGKRGVFFIQGDNPLDSEYMNRVAVERMQTLAKKYENGGMVRLFFLNSRFPTTAASSVLVTSMEYAREMLSFHGSSKHWHKGRAYDVSEPLIGNSVLRASGDVWSTQRTVMERAMRNMMKNPKTIDRVVATANKLVEKWLALPAGVAVEVPEECLRLTMDVIGSAAFSHDFQSVTGGSEGNEAPLYGPFQIILHTLNRRCQRLHEHLLRALPIEANLQFNTAMKTLQDQVDRLVSKHDENNAETSVNGDMLDVLIEARETGEISPQAVKENVQTALFAGHDTTGAALTWMLRLLAKHPEKMQRLREEIYQKFGKQGSPKTDAELDKLLYLNAVVLETLRLYPSAAFTRMSDHDVVIGAKHIVPAGTEMMIMPYLFHHDARYWDKPDEFSPERFLHEELIVNESGAAKDKTQQDGEFLVNSLQSRIGRISAKKAFFPFSLGPRNCVGRSLALMEMRVVLVKLIQRFRFEDPQQENEEVSDFPVFALTLNPPTNIKLRPVPLF